MFRYGIDLILARIIYLSLQGFRLEGSAPKANRPSGNQKEEEVVKANKSLLSIDYISTFIIVSSNRDTPKYICSQKILIPQITFK